MIYKTKNKDVVIVAAPNIEISFFVCLCLAADRGQEVHACQGRTGCDIVSMDLSKAFDVIQHDLLLAKLKAYGVGEGSCKLLKNYLSGRQQRVKIGDTFSNWAGTRGGVPQGSVLGPMFFNMKYGNCLLYTSPSPRDA